MTQIRNRVRAIILAIAGFIVTLLIIRLLLILFSADESQPLIKFIYDLTNPLIVPFVPERAVSVIGSFDFGLILALVVYIIVGILFAGIVASFLHEHPGEIVINVVDAIFKVFEFLLITRLVFSLFAVVPDSTGFVTFIYSSTNWASGIFPSVDLFTGELELSVFAVLTIFVVVDLATEQLVKAMFEKEKEDTTVATVAPQQVIVQPQAPEPQPKTQTINITVPIQQIPQPIQVDRQVMNSYPTQSKPDTERKGIPPPSQQKRIFYPPGNY